MHFELSAVQAAENIRSGLISSVELVKACLQRIEDTDGELKAWVHLDAENALAQAEALDEIRFKGLPLGPLHGVPVGIKDIFDTSDMPTQLGTEIHAGRQPEHDAAVIERLREAGAVILGKTVTTEFAYTHPSITTNPHNPAHSPGGSSSGSAAAVAAGHLPLAIGSQTGGSTIRPASYCGIYGFKPTRGVISRRGVLETSRILDQVGIFGRSLEDLALLGDTLGSFDREDSMSYARPRPRLLEGCKAEPPVEPNFAWFELPFNDLLSDAAAEGLEEVRNVLGDQVEVIPAPRSFSKVVECHKVIHEYEIARNLKAEIDNHWDEISDTIKPKLESGLATTQAQYHEALAMVAGAENYFDEFFNDYDAVLTSSATGEAPLIGSDDGTGNPIYSVIWTFAGLPCLSLPVMSGELGLPMGLQLVGSREGDDRLFRTARWLLHQLEAATDDND
jgi:Asp-tRNA(Asn)/Glu-tRNA(Gln) amidotransferase A subunit family amidase